MAAFVSSFTLDDAKHLPKSLMELGAFFHDDLFEEARDKTQKAAPISYNAKICTPQWFDEAEGEDDTEEMQLHKFRGDWAFRNKDFDKALKHFSAAQRLLPSSNVPMLRDILESTARSHLALGQPTDALPLALRLVAKSANFDQKTGSLQLLAATYQALQNLTGELQTLQKLVWMHPMGCDGWARMADIYNELHHHGNAHSLHGNQQNDPPSQQQTLPKVQFCDEEQHVNSHSQPECVTDIAQNNASDGIAIPDMKLGNADLITEVEEKLGQTSLEPHVSTGRDSNLVLATCLLRTGLLAQTVGRVPPFVKHRYREIYSKVKQTMEGLDLPDHVVTKCRSVVSADVTGDKEEMGSRSADGSTEADILREVDLEGFGQMFEERWFSWS